MVQPGNGSRPEKCPLSSCIAISLRDKSAYCSILSFIHSFQPTHDNNLFQSLKFLVFILKSKYLQMNLEMHQKIYSSSQKLPITHCKYSLMLQLVFSQMGSFNYPSDKSQLDERIRQNCTHSVSICYHTQKGYFSSSHTCRETERPK